MSDDAADYEAPSANEALTPETRLWFWRRQYLMDRGLSREQAEDLLADPSVDWLKLRVTGRRH
jgi:hypothetical protein